MMDVPGENISPRSRDGDMAIRMRRDGIKMRMTNGGNPH